MPADSPDAFLAHVLQVFRPYLDQLVLVGGFAARLYALHPQAVPTGLRLLRTFDADFATPPRVERGAGQSLYDLAQAAGFDEELLGEHVPPVMRFVLRRDKERADRSAGEQFTVEFLTPLTGRAVNRTGRPRATVTVQERLTAQQLRYLDLLLEAPWSVSLGALPGVAHAQRNLAVQVPHPGLFIVQKVLIWSERDPAGKRPKDIAYLYQVLVLFREILPQLAQEVQARMGVRAAWREWLTWFLRTAADLFATPARAAVREAHRVLQAELIGTAAPAPTPAQIHGAVQAFLREFVPRGRVQRQ